MTSFVAVLGLVFAAAVVLGLVVLVAALASGRVTLASPRSDEVLPSHYSSLVETTPSNYPGYCVECGTDNDPEYSRCRNCSSKLPEAGYERNNGTTNGFPGQE